MSLRCPFGHDPDKLVIAPITGLVYCPVCEEQYNATVCGGGAFR